MDWMYLFSILLGFLAVVLMLEGAYLMWRSYAGQEARRIRERLSAVGAGQGPSARTELLLKQRGEAGHAMLHRALERLGGTNNLEQLLQQAGLSWTPNGLIMRCAAFAIGGAILAVMIPLPWHGLLKMLIGLTAGLLPISHVLRVRAKRVQRMEEQLPDALDLMARGMRAGHAFSSALQMVGQEAAEPIAREFRVTFDEINYGLPVDEALAGLTERVPSADVKYFVVGVLIQRESGGNLAELLENLALLVRERIKLLGRVRVLAAEGKLSAWILTLLPFCLAAVINLVNPGFMAVLWTDPMGLNMVGLAFLMMFLGIMWMRKIIRIRV